MEDGETRLRIMRAATRHFVRHGFAKTTADEVAAGLGISKKTLYRFFPSKEELFRQTVLMHIEEVRADFEAIGKDRESGFIDRLRRTIRVVARKLREVGTFFEEKNSRLPPRIMEEMLRLRQEVVIGFFRKLFREGRRQGFVKKNINENIFIAVLVIILQSLFHPETLSALPFGSYEVFSTLCSLILEGVLSEKAHRDFSLSQIEVEKNEEVLWNV